MRHTRHFCCVIHKCRKSERRSCFLVLLPSVGYSGRLFLPASSLPERVDLPDVGNLYRESAQLPQKRWPRRPERYSSHFASARCLVGQKWHQQWGQQYQHRRYERYSRKHQPDPAREPVSKSDERRTNAHSLEKTIQNNQCSKNPECGAESQAYVNAGT